MKKLYTFEFEEADVGLIEQAAEKAGVSPERWLEDRVRQELLSGGCLDGDDEPTPPKPGKGGRRPSFSHGCLDTDEA